MGKLPDYAQEFSQKFLFLFFEMEMKFHFIYILSYFLYMLSKGKSLHETNFYYLHQIDSHHQNIK